MPSSRALTTADLKRARLLKDVEPDALARLVQVGRVHELEEGDHLWRAGEVASRVVEILRGLVHVERTLASGATTTLGIFGPHEHVGVPAVLEAGTYPADAIAASTVLEVAVFPAEAVLSAMPASPMLGSNVQRALLQHTHALRAKIDVLSAGSVPARLATLLVHLSERFGDETAEGLTSVPIALSRASLARLVSARVETVIRTMSKWQRADLVRTTSEGFEIPSPEELLRTAQRG